MATATRSDEVKLTIPDDLLPGLHEQTRCEIGFAAWELKQACEELAHADAFDDRRYRLEGLLRMQDDLKSEVPLTHRRSLAMVIARQIESVCGSDEYAMDPQGFIDAAREVEQLQALLSAISDEEVAA